MLVTYPGAAGAMSYLYPGNRLPACNALAAADEKAGESFMRYWLHVHTADLCFGRTLPAPGQQLFNLHICASCCDVNGAIMQVLHVAGNAQPQRFFPGTVPVKNSLYFSFYGNGNGLQHTVSIQ